MKSQDILQVEKILGVKFSEKFLIEKAFTHKSISKMSGLNNERLEFLGDRVLGLVIASYLSNEYPEDTEGMLDKKLASLVNKEACSEVISNLKIDKFVNLSRSQRLNKAGYKKIFGDLESFHVNGVCIVNQFLNSQSDNKFAMSKEYFLDKFFFDKNENK